IRAAVVGWGQERYGQRSRALGDRAEPDVSKARIVLLIAAGTDWAAVVGYLGQVDVRDSLPDRGGLLELSLPGGRRKPGVQRLEEHARCTADVGSVRDETVSDAATISPLAAQGGIQEQPVFKRLQPETSGSSGHLCSRFTFQFE